jgi:hypothetical protein
MLTDFERDVQELTGRLLDEYAPMFERLGFRPDNRGIKVRNPAPEARCSELEVVFYRGKDIGDIFEFFVERDGKPQATLYEFEEWLRAELRELPLRHPSG